METVVKIQFDEESIVWDVALNVREYEDRYAQVTMGCGWKDFVASNVL